MHSIHCSAVQQRRCGSRSKCCHVADVTVRTEAICCLLAQLRTSASATNCGTYFASLSFFRASVKNLNCSVRVFWSTSYTTPLPKVGTLKLYTCTPEQQEVVVSRQQR